MRPVPVDLSASHQSISELLPFLANDSLAGAEREEVERHLQTCAGCRHEFALEQRLLRAFRATDAGAAVAGDRFERVLQRVRALPAEPARAQRPRFAQFALAASLVSLVIGGGYLGFGRSGPPTAGAYHTLARDAGRSAGADVIYVRFAPAVADATVNALLAGAHTTILNGPNTDHVFTVRALDADLGRTVAALQAHAEITFVAPAAVAAGDRL